MWDPSSGLVETKFAAPQPRGDLIARPRLQQLMAAGEAVALTAVVAPAGSGKSTLLGEWYRRRTGNGDAVAWLSLETADDEALRFSTYLAAALQRAHPRLGSRALGLLQSLLTHDEERLLPLLINDLAAYDGRVALFLDDLHLLTQPAVHRLLERLLSYAPENFHLFVASRSEPPLALARFRLQERACLVEAQELRFDLSESERFLNAARSLALSGAEIALLHQRTEGWAAGLRLAALALERRHERASFLASFSGTHREVTAFLAQDVLLRQPQEVQDFLLRTSVLARFDAEVARAVTGRADARAMIEQLISASLFLVPLDSGRRWHRYHHLFADFLRAQLDRVYPGEAERLHRRAAAWHAAAGDVGEALHHALAAGDDEDAAALLESEAMRYVREGRLTQLRDWLARLPPAVLQARPRLLMVQVWLGFHMLQAREAFRQLRAARAALNGSADAALLAELRVLTAGVLSAADHNAWSRDLARRWLETLPADQPFLQGVLANILAFSEYTLGDLAAAQAACERARAAHGRARSVFGLVYADLLQSLVEKARGRPGAAEALLRRAWQLAGEALGQPSYAGAIVAVLLAELAYERDDLAECERLLRENHYIVEGKALVVHSLAGLLHLARLEALAGRPDAAVAVLDRAERLGRQEKYRRLRAAVLNERVRLLLAQGDLAGAQAALGASDLGERRDASERPATELEQVALGRVLIGERRFERALAVLEAAGRRMQAQGRQRRFLALCCLKAVALQRAGRLSEALALLRPTLAQAEVAGLFRSVADEAALLRPALAELQRRGGADGPSLSYLQRLMAAAGTPPPRHIPLPATAGEESAGVLSERELDIVRLLASGHASTEALAGRLALAPTTVKWHLRNIFDKLGVKSRAEVIVTASRLGLLN